MTNYIWPFGKYKNYTLVDIPTKHLRWIVAEGKRNPDTLFRGPLLEQVKTELVRRALE